MVGSDHTHDITGIGALARVLADILYLATLLCPLYQMIKRDTTRGRTDAGNLLAG